MAVMRMPALAWEPRGALASHRYHLLSFIRLGYILNHGHGAAKTPAPVSPPWAYHGRHQPRHLPHAYVIISCDYNLHRGYGRYVYVDLRVRILEDTAV